MCLFVFCHVVSFGKAFPTKSADIRFFPGMNSFMVLQMSLLFETFTTSSARIGSFASMTSFMTHHFMSVFDAFTTSFTFYRKFICVDFFMNLQGGQFCKLLSTASTMEWFFCILIISLQLLFMQLFVFL